MACDTPEIFPAGPNETRGMEDARFVQFTDTDGSVRYYATYTAYDGFEILPQLIQTDDFVQFTVSTLNGAAAQNTPGWPCRWRRRPLRSRKPERAVAPLLHG